MGTITIKNLSTRADWVAITAVAFLMSEGRGALRKEFGEDINITQRGNTYTVRDAENQQNSAMPEGPDTAQK